MPAPEHDNRRQKAVLWTRKGVNRQGQVTLNDPVEIMVRWKWVKREMVDRQGNTIAIDAEVVTVADVAVGSVMWLGSLDDLPGTALLPEVDAMAVVSAPTTPDIKNRFKARTLMLMRIKDTLPEL